MQKENTNSQNNAQNVNIISNKLGESTHIKRTETGPQKDRDQTPIAENQQETQNEKGEQTHGRTLVLHPKRATLKQIWDALRSIPHTSDSEPYKATQMARAIELRFDSAESMDRATTHLQKLEEGGDLTMGNKQPRRERVIVYKVPPGCTVDVMEQKLRQLINSPQADIKVEEIKNNLQGELSNWIVSISPRAKQKLIGKKQVMIGFTPCRISAYFTITRCQKCQSFHHSTANCKCSSYYCANCSENHHVTECRERRKSCVNCKEANHDSQGRTNFRTDHRASDFRCPYYKRYKAEYLEKRTRNESNRPTGSSLEPPEEAHTEVLPQRESEHEKPQLSTAIKQKYPPPYYIHKNHSTWALTKKGQQNTGYPLNPPPTTYERIKHSDYPPPTFHRLNPQDLSSTNHRPNAYELPPPTYKRKVSLVDAQPKITLVRYNSTYV